jgi:hypothetical protein
VSFPCLGGFPVGGAIVFSSSQLVASEQLLPMACDAMMSCIDLKESKACVCAWEGLGKALLAVVFPSLWVVASWWSCALRRGFSSAGLEKQRWKRKQEKWGGEPQAQGQTNLSFPCAYGSVYSRLLTVAASFFQLCRLSIVTSVACQGPVNGEQVLVRNAGTQP